MKSYTLHLKDFYNFLGDDGKDPTLDIYIPNTMPELKRENEKRPNVVICPGGAYLMRSQREAEPAAFHFLTEGYNVFVLQYSVDPHRFPSQIIEVAAVFDLIYKNAEEWNCDTSKIAIMGFSAGGHLAGHYTTRYDCKEIRAYFPESKPANASILCYPVVTAEPEHGHIVSINVLSGKEDRTREEIDYFSNEKNVREDTPPTFIWHTSADTNVSVTNSLLYAMALKEKNVPFELHIYPFGFHGLATSDYHTNNNLKPEDKYTAVWKNSLKSWLKLIGFTNE